MNQFFDECQSYQEASILFENFNFKSPPLSAKIETLPSTTCKLTVQSDEQDIYENKIPEKRLTSSFYQVIHSQFKANFNQNAFDSFILEEIDQDEYLNEILTSSKSCQMNNQLDKADEQNGFQTSKSAEIDANKKSFQNQSRKEKVERYKLKKPKRNFYKVIRYECRKKVAVDRVRVAGRFQKETLSAIKPQNLEENFANDSDKTSKRKISKQKQILLRNSGKKPS